MHYLRPSKALLLGTFSAVLISGLPSLPALANSSNNVIRQGLPGRRISGGVRLDPASSCFSNFNQSLVAVIPRSNLGKTAAERPTFWFSVPETNGTKVGKFQLFNSAEELVYTTQFEIDERYVLREFQLPETAPGLLTNENYRWVFEVTCPESSEEESLSSAQPRLGLQGWVRRVELPGNLASQISTATAEEKVSLYAEAGLWHEQITELINLRRSSLNNVDYQLAWASVIEANGLADHISSALAEAVTPAQIASPSASSASLTRITF